MQIQKPGFKTGCSPSPPRWATFKIQSMKKPSTKELLANEHHDTLQACMEVVWNNLVQSNHPQAYFGPYVRQETLKQLWTELPSEERADLTHRSKEWGLKVGEDDKTRIAYICSAFRKYLCM